MKISSIPHIYRNVKRWTEIISVLSKFGLADWMSQSNIDFCKDQLTATDADFTVGSGALVQGPLLHLVMAMAGRSRYLTELDGDGVAELRHRIKPSRDTLTG